jgi:hypothetical protein
MKLKSELLQDNFTYENGTVTFDSGVKYNADEVVKLEASSNEMKKAVHKVKIFFGGEVVK